VGRQRDQLVRPTLGRTGHSRELARGRDHLPRLQGRSAEVRETVICMIRRFVLTPWVLTPLIILAVIKTIWGGMTWNIWHVLAGLGALVLFWYALRHAKS